MLVPITASNVICGRCSSISVRQRIEFWVNSHLVLMSRENSRDNGPGPTSVSTVGGAAEQQMPVVIEAVCFKNPVKSLLVIGEGRAGGQTEAETTPVYKHVPTIQLKCPRLVSSQQWIGVKTHFKQTTCDFYQIPAAPLVLSLLSFSWLSFVSGSWLTGWGTPGHLWHP